MSNKPAYIGLWRSTRENGPIASGKSGGIEFTIWPNDKRGNDRAPDFNLVISAAQRQQDDRPRQQNMGFDNGGHNPPAPQPSRDDGFGGYSNASQGGSYQRDDEIPF